MSKHFSKGEFACRCGCGAAHIHPQLLAGLEALREKAQAAVFIQSGCRCRRRNRAVGGAANSYHLCCDGAPGRAADVKVRGCSVREIYEMARTIPVFQGGGIGVYPEQGFVHLDVRGARARWGKLRGQYVSLEEALAHGSDQ